MYQLQRGVQPASALADADPVSASPLIPTIGSADGWDETISPFAGLSPRGATAGRLLALDGGSTVQKKYRTLIMAGATLALPGALVAQQNDAPAAQAQPAAAAQPAQTTPTPQEVAQLRQRLGELQQRAAQDPGVKAANDAFNADVLTAMTGLDPEAAGKKSRADALPGEVQTARTANDNARLTQLAEEATTLQAYFAQLRQRALALPEIEEKRQAYVAQLFAKMKELDPEAQSIVDRLEAARSAGVQAPPAAATSPR
jgi:hypothetical protein